MKKVIVYTNENGGVTVCYPNPDLDIDLVKNKDTPESSFILNEEDLPNEYDEFFNAWEIDNTKIVVNLIKAKEITKERLRAERKPLLEAQDVAFQRALESNSDTSAIVAEKQRLRDITKLADQATTLDELKAMKA